MMVRFRIMDRSTRIIMELRTTRVDIAIRKANREFGKGNWIIQLKNGHWLVPDVPLVNQPFVNVQNE